MDDTLTVRRAAALWADGIRKTLSPADLDPRYHL
jgi:hypothetical protein